MTKHNNPRSVVLCYISGLDLRWIDADTTPFLACHAESSHCVRLSNLPSNELFPTLVTGVDPTVHRVWGVRIADDIEDRLRAQPVDLVPSVVATTVQCIMHRLGGTYDLAAIPPTRRRRFEITRTKYKRRQKKPEALFEINSVETVLGMVGERQAEYTFTSTPDPGRDLLAALCQPGKTLEILELYSLDRLQQWWLHDRVRVAAMYRRVDRFLASLAEKCERHQKLLMVVSDHGHEAIRNVVDLNRELGTLRIPQNEYTHFVEVSSARFWFHTDRARREICKLLDRLENLTVVPYDEMHRFGVPLEEPGWGELFCFLDPGNVFFPHDFNQPLANWYFALTDPMQRRRLFDAHHRGNHGHLPHFEAENSFMLLASEQFRTRHIENANILDVAPSLLNLLGLQIPRSMTGRPLFRAA